MGQMFIVNAPWIFRVCWAIAKGWQDENTSKVITVLGPDFLPTLSEFVDIE